MYELSYAVACELLRQVLLDALSSRSDTERSIGSVRSRACAALYALLMDHPIDWWGRCRSCRRSGSLVGGRRRRCRVHIEVRYWLHQPDDTYLRTHVAAELGMPLPSHLADQDTTVVLHEVEGKSLTEPRTGLCAAFSAVQVHRVPGRHAPDAPASAA